MAKMEPTPTGTVEKLTDAELSKILGRYQAMESVSILIGALLVAAGCISAFVVHSRKLLAILALSGVALMLVVGLPAQKKKKALLQQQMGGFFRAKLELRNQLKAVYDSAGALMNWFSGQLADKEILSPEDFGELAEAVTAERIRDAARMYTLATVYTLSGQNSEG